MPKARGSSATPVAAANDPAISVARSLAHVLDHWRLDPIAGLLLPVIGDVICGLIGLIIVGIAAAKQVPKVTLARMLLNVAFDAMLGSIPLIGDVLDFWFPAHTINVRLLERASRQHRSHPMDYVILGLAMLACLVAFTLPIVALVLAIRYFVTH